MDVRDFIASRLHVMQPKKVLVAFIAGVQYHDALAAFRRQNFEQAGRIVKSDDLDRAFEIWHIAMAQAMGVEPTIPEPFNPEQENENG